jgi:uncharacterized coiled-coil protein SlyX
MPARDVRDNAHAPQSVKREQHRRRRVSCKENRTLMRITNIVCAQTAQRTAAHNEWPCAIDMGIEDKMLNDRLNVLQYLARWRTRRKNAAMKRPCRPALPPAVYYSALVLCGGLAQGLAQAAGPHEQEQASGRLDALDRQVAEQLRRLDALKASVAEQEAILRDMQRALGSEQLTNQRGRGGAAAASDTSPSDAGAAPQPVGAAPARDKRPAEVATLFEQPGLLTPKGRYVLEPSLQYGYSSTNRVALVGYTVIPALLVGLIDVREVKRNTTTATMTGRFGITERFEIEARVPYVYRSDSTVSREIFSGTAVENVFDTSGKGIGDVEVTGRYQFNSSGADQPYFIGSMRFKSRTGRDPFEVVTDCSQRCTGNTSGTGLPLDLPTGSGFYALQPGITMLYPSDPAVFFASATYLHNFKRHDVSRKILAGNEEFLGTIDPGDIIGFNFGMGLALNEKSSFSLGYDHSSIGRTKLNGTTVPGSVRTQLGTLLLGYSHRLKESTTLNVSVGAGLTRDTPDVTLTVRLPTTF